MSEFLCTACGHLAPAPAGTCTRCGSNLLLPADAPSARQFIARHRAPPPASGDAPTGLRAQATGKVLGRALGKLLWK